MRMTANENKMTARERLASLFDGGTFQEIHSEGVITGKGAIADRDVYAFAQDYSINAGAMTESMAEKICEVMDPHRPPCRHLPSHAEKRHRGGCHPLSSHHARTPGSLLP